MAEENRLDINEYLKRPDKWYLGGGDAVIWAPPFPVWLENMGMWDTASFYNHDYGNVFAITVLDDNFNVLKMKQIAREWRPSHLECFYVESVSSEPPLGATESKMVLPNDTLVSEVLFSNGSDKELRMNIVFWTMGYYSDAKTPGSMHTVSCDNEMMRFHSVFRITTGPEVHASTVMGIDRKADSFLVQLSQTGPFQPVWEYTPFFDRYNKDGLPNEVNVTGVRNRGIVYLGQHLKLVLPPNSKEKVRFLCSIATKMEKSEKSFHATSSPNFDSLKKSRENWDNWFRSVPYFECSDEYIQKYYWYRWYGLRLMTTFGDIPEQPYPSINEGISYFRGPISYSAWCHMLEMRWHHDPEIARGCLLNFIHKQRENGSFPGTILHQAGVGWDFFHANWGPAVIGLDFLHPDDSYLETVYGGMLGYVRYMDSERDHENSGLYDVIDQFETGQEFMSRYMAVSPDADKGKGEALFRLKGIDATIAVYNIKRLMGFICRRLGKNDEAIRWDEQAEAIKNAVVNKMWNPAKSMFSDAIPGLLDLTNIKSLVCFQPYCTDIVEKKHLQGFCEHLFNPVEFWTPYPAASTSIDDKYYHPDGLWKKRRHNCPWNGRVWPMQNSFIAEAIAGMAIHHDSSLKIRFEEFLGKYIRMMFDEGDPIKPNCYEHYNPVNSRESVFRGINDYQHSTVVDLIIKYVVGFRPQQDGSYKVEPFCKGINQVVLKDLLYRGKRIDICIENGKADIREYKK